MVSFDHRAAGTAEERWARTAPLHATPVLDDGAITSLLVVAAHPDDETLGAAGLLARCAARGVPVSVLVLTDGEGSHPRSPTWEPADLATTRRAELVTALGAVAPRAAVRFLALPDGGLREQAALVRAEIAAVAERGATVVAPWSGDGHRDHRVAGECARQVAAALGCELLEYPVWFWHWGDPDADALPWEQVCRVELTEEEVAAKARALAAHTTQTTALSEEPGDEVLLSATMVAHFTRGFETFVRTPATGSGRAGASLDASFFDAFYSGRSDPWGFQTRWYEERKRALTLAALPRRRFAAGLEVGCSIGVLTAELAPRCEQLLAIDIAAAPLEEARTRVPSSVTLRRFATPGEWPEGVFDLVVLSEVGYYCSADDLDLLLARVVGSLAPDGVVLACHWRHPVAEYPLTGDAVHAALAGRRELAATVRHEEEDFLLEVFARPPVRSVAAETGLR